MEYGTQVTTTILSVDGDDGHGRWEPIYNRLTTTDAGSYKIEEMSLASKVAGIYNGMRVTLWLSERGRVYTLEGTV